MSDTKPLQPARQTDWQAANSAAPDTDRQPAWDDEGWDAYLWAVDADYRIDWYLDHGDEEAAREEVEEVEEERERRIESGDWSDADEEDYLLGWCDDEE